MADRIRLDDLTDPDLERLYAELEAHREFTDQISVEADNWTETNGESLVNLRHWLTELRNTVDDLHNPPNA
ncbi:hypothetical protein [Streptomyces sp. NPDC053048]|uniref:hypothetical protein n=1 Tax=Streptomyces sp. NPDC053048 TaxID=3365694 RepID=UPI0037CEF5D7